MINLAEQAVKLVRDVGSPAYKIHFDTFHGNIEEKSLPETIRKLGKACFAIFTPARTTAAFPGPKPPGCNGIMPPGIPE